MPGLVTPEMRACQNGQLRHHLRHQRLLAWRAWHCAQAAADLIENYFIQYPGVYGRNIEFTRQHGYVKTIPGRRRYLRDITSQRHRTPRPNAMPSIPWCRERRRPDQTRHGQHPS